MRHSIRIAACLALAGPAHASAPRLAAPERLQGEAPRIDGLVDDAVWQTAKVYDSFVQQEPNQGEPATERTEVRLLLSQDAVYIGIVCFDSEPQGVVATAMRRDSDLTQSDSVQVLFDTFNDGQNGFIFGTNPLGIEYDGQVAGEGETSGFSRQQGQAGSTRGQISGFNPNWDGTWSVSARRTERGWEAEMAIPFKTLRYAPGDGRTWGFNVMRNIRRKNEQVFLAFVPRGQTIQRVSLAAKLEGLSLPGRRDLTVTPYLVGRSTRDLSPLPRLEDDSADVGGDLKWGITPQLTLDLTVNTDFAQVEADDEQINLTRFELFFPEKRPFFLENASMFQLGQPQQIDLFFSRRVGLSASGIPVDIQGGARLSGKIGHTNVALLDMQTAGASDPRSGSLVAPASNFGVARVQRERGRANYGAILINRAATSEAGSFSRFNRAFGADATVPVGRYGKLFTFAAATQSPDPIGADWAGRAFYTLTGPVWGGHLGVGRVGKDFIAESGFVPRRNFVRPEARIAWNSPQFHKLSFIRRATPHVSWNTFYGLDGTRQTTFLHVHLTDFALANGGRIGWEWNYNEDRPLARFAVYQPRVGQSVSIPAGFYAWNDTQTILQSNPSASTFGELRYKRGGYYDGRYDSWDVRAGVRSGGKFQATVQYVRENHRLPGGNFTTELLPLRVSWSFTPQISVQALVQYNGVASQVGTNLRFAWLMRSGTGLFVVYNDRHDTARLTPETALGRSLIVKFSRLVDF